MLETRTASGFAGCCYDELASEPTHNSELWVMNENGSGQHKVAAAAAYAEAYSETYSWAPDSAKLAFIAGGGLWLANTDGSNPVQVVASPNTAWAPSYAPSGTKIAYAGTNGSGKSQIWAVNTDGTGLTNLSNTPANTDLDPVYSPTGTKIAFTRYVNQYYGWTGDVYVMNADGTGKTNLTNSQNTYGAAFSPDGTKIAFTGKTGTQIDLYTVPVSGGAATRLTTGRNIYGIPAWSQDGTKLTFSSNQDIYTINADGTGQTNVTNNASANNTFPGWSTGTTPVVANIYYIYPDHLNTPRAITNEANTTVWKWDNIDPFGANVPNEDPDGNSQAFVFNLRFPGQYADKETNLHYNYFRDYDPSIGRYVESDPIGLDGGVNTYAYVGGNPLSKIDPSGTIGLGAVIAGATIIGAGYTLWEFNKAREKCKDDITRKEECELKAAKDYFASPSPERWSAFLTAYNERIEAEQGALRCALETLEILGMGAARDLGMHKLFHFLLR